MAQFDPSIISQIPDFAPNPIRAKEEAYKLSDLMDTNTLNKMKLSEAKQQSQEQQTYKQVLSGYDLSKDDQATKAAEELTRRGLPDKAMQFTKERQAIKGGALDIQTKQLEIAESQQSALVTSMDGVVRQVDAYKHANPNATPAMLDAKTQELITPVMGQLAEQRPDLVPAIDRFRQSPGAFTYQGVIAAEAATKSGLARLKELRDEQKGDREDKRLDIAQQQANNTAALTGARIENYESLARTRNPALLPPEILADAVPDVMMNPEHMKNYFGSKTYAQNRIDQINKGIDDRLHAAGLTGEDLPRLRAQNKAESTSLNKLIPQANAVDAYEKLAKFNGNRLIQLIDQLDDTGIPLIEGPKRYAERKGGSADAGEFASVLTSYQGEVAKILNNPNLTGVTHRGAIEDMQHVISGDVSADQAKRIINRITLEMDFRQNSLKDAIMQAGAAMTAPGGTPGTGTPAGAIPPPATVPPAPKYDPNQPGQGLY